MTNLLIQEKTSCRVCGHSPLISIISLGELYVSDFIDDSGSAEPISAPLELMLCKDCGLVQLRHTVSHESLYRNYWYRSGMNKTMTNELRDITERVEEIISLRAGDLVLDIGSNDGTLLRSYRTEDLTRVGFEPARNIAKNYGTEGITKVFNDFFNFEAWQKEFGGAQAKVITAIAMFYDLEEPNSFVADVARCLDDNGLFVIQMAYLPSMLQKNAFDGICHEHLEIYSLTALENLLARHNLEVFDVALRDINEGSFRAYIRHKGRGSALNVPRGAEERVRALREAENKLDLRNKDVYEDFVRRVHEIKNKTVDFIQREVALGKKVYVYGASTKGNTLLQFFGLDHALIQAAAERNPDKWGKRTVGTNIPIISEEEARNAKPDYFLVLPWHFIVEFKSREEDFLKRGGKFIIPLPEFEIIAD